MRQTGICLTAMCVAAGIADARAQRVTEVRLATPSPLLASVVSHATGAVAGVSADHKLRIWDTKSGQVSRTIDVTGRDFALLSMSFDGQLLVMGDYGGRVTIWNTGTGEVVWEPSVRRYPTAAAFSRDGRLLALAPGSPVQLFDLSSRQIVRELETTPGTTAVVFSRDGRSLATTDGDGVRIYDVESGRVLARNDDFAGVQLAVEFSADGKRLLAAGGDRAVLLIDATTGTTLRRSAKLSDPVFYLEASPNGHDLAVVTQNADDPQRRVPIAFVDIASGTSRFVWRSPSGVLLPGAGWTLDGQLIIVTQRSDTVHVWSIRP